MVRNKQYKKQKHNKTISRKKKKKKTSTTTTTMMKNTENKRRALIEEERRGKTKKKQTQKEQNKREQEREKSKTQAKKPKFEKVTNCTPDVPAWGFNQFSKIAQLVPNIGKHSAKIKLVSVPNRRVIYCTIFGVIFTPKVVQQTTLRW